MLARALDENLSSQFCISYMLSEILSISIARHPSLQLYDLHVIRTAFFSAMVPSSFSAPGCYEDPRSDLPPCMPLRSDEPSRALGAWSDLFWDSASLSSSTCLFPPGDTRRTPSRASDPDWEVSRKVLFAEQAAIITGEIVVYAMKAIAQDIAAKTNPWKFLPSKRLARTRKRYVYYSLINPLYKL